MVATATASYASGVILVLVLGDRARGLLHRLRRRDAANADTAPEAIPAPTGRLRRVWDRYGVVGLGLLAPMTVGSHTGALLGLALKARPRALLIWMTLGALVWSALISAIALLGLIGLQAAS